MIETGQQVERALLVGVSDRTQTLAAVEDSLAELSLLATTAGAEVVDVITQNRNRVDTAFYIGKGKAGDIVDRAPV